MANLAAPIRGGEAKGQSLHPETSRVQPQPVRLLQSARDSPSGPPPQRATFQPRRQKMINLTL